MPPAIRSRHLEDPVYGPSWKEILRDFDQKPLERFCCFRLTGLRYGKDAVSEAQAAMLAAAKEETEAAAPVLEPWQEPERLEVLLDQYIIESKCAGRLPGSSLFLVHSKKRDGTVNQVTGDQRYKLFLAPSMQNLIFKGPELNIKHDRSRTLDLHEAAHSDLQLTRVEFQLSHGSSKFVKNERVAAMRRQDETNQGRRMSYTLDGHRSLAVWLRF